MFTLFLVLHSIGGALGLLTGLVIMVRPKGDQVHTFWGKLYTNAMLLSGFTALVLSGLHPNYFLACVGLFTLYMVSSGRRYIYFQKQNQFKPQVIDRAITLLMLIVGYILMVLGILLIVKENFFGLVLLLYGGIGLMFVYQDTNNYKHNKLPIKNKALVGHIQRMVGSYIAALTAFLVINANYFPVVIPNFVYWLLPTFIFTPLLIKWSRI